MIHKGRRNLFVYFGALVLLWSVLATFITLNLTSTIHQNNSVLHPMGVDQPQHWETKHTQYHRGNVDTDSGIIPLRHHGWDHDWVQSTLHRNNNNNNSIPIHDAMNQEKLKQKGDTKRRHMFHLPGFTKHRMQPRNHAFAILPKIYDTQGRATVCVTRNNQTKRCQLHPCTHDGLEQDQETNIGLDDYGFVVHKHSNTRGLRPATAGRASVGSGCAISHRYKFIYIHVLKSGGMTVKSMLKNALCGSTQACEDLQIVDCLSVVQAFPRYFTFAFVRNPFSRIYSAYSMAESMKKSNNVFPTFPEFATMNVTKRRHYSKTAVSHYYQQVSFVMDTSKCPLIDFLGRLERFREDMQIILNQIQSPELQRFFDASAGRELRDNCTSYGERKKRAELGGKLQNAYQSQATVDAVIQEFASDFSLLAYDTNTIP